MHFNLVSLFPEFFTSPLREGLMGRALEKGLITCSLHNPRDGTPPPHHTVDDRPYGGGPGMVMLLEPLLRTLRALPRPGRMLALSPAGRPFTQSLARELAREPTLTLICGRYEGFDARLAALAPVDHVSLGDCVLNGGETPALAIMEAVGRLVPGFMGKEQSGEEESFSAGLLEYPHYTRPEVLEGCAVPEVLRSGDHQRIARWRREQALETTLRYRPDLLEQAPLNAADAAHLASLPRLRPGRNLHLVLVHYPVVVDGQQCGATSLTNLDVHDLARTARSYGLGGVHVVTPLVDQHRILGDILRHWCEGPAAARHPDRADALRLVRGAASVEEALEAITTLTGQAPLLVGTSARWPHRKWRLPLLSRPEARACLEHRPMALLLGTGQGLAPQLAGQCDALLPPVRGWSDFNHLSVRAAAAILVDRILGDSA